MKSFFEKKMKKIKKKIVYKSFGNEKRKNYV